MIQKVVLIGAGNLATHLAVVLSEKRFRVLQVYNRSPQKGQILAATVGADYIADLGSISLNADIYILAITDSVVREVAMDIPLKNQLVVHTSGTLDMKILDGVSDNIGVFYPLQTFSSGRKIDFNDVPVCIEANSRQCEDQLAEFAIRLSANVQIVSSSNRKILHLSAVFASNFTNFMYVIAEQLLNEHQISFDLLKPLIRQTIQNAAQHDLFSFQTGPAVRGDQQVLEKHREILAAHPGYLDIYNLLSANIIKYKALHGKL
jgi:predicted short-subunit dehydrogenase-like oxidoreductase (DUF2520 family)